MAPNENGRDTGSRKAPACRVPATLVPPNTTRSWNVYQGMSVVDAVRVGAAVDDQSDRLGCLFDTHQARLYRLARRLARDAEDARDLVQDTFLRAARSPGSVPAGTARQQAWLVRVLVNVSRDQWRKTAVRQRSHWPRPAVSHSSEESAIIARRTIWQALDILAPRRRAVIILHELDGLTVSDTAQLLGISPVTVRWHLARARRDLGRILKPHLEDHP